MKLGGYEVVDNMGLPAGSSSSSQQPQQAGNNKSQNTKNSSSMTGVSRDILKNSASCLSMPSPKLQTTYITNLLDNKNDFNSSSATALKYLTEERGLTTQTLRKFGVGLGSYQFPSIKPGQQNKFVRADCITFPWIMKASEINEQETLRGGAYKADNSTNGDGARDPFVTRRIKARSLTSKGNQRLDPPG